MMVRILVSKLSTKDRNIHLLGFKDERPVQDTRMLVLLWVKRHLGLFYLGFSNRHVCKDPL